MDNSQTKSKERVRDRGEVFTAEREVKAMCDLVKDECERIDSRFLEPACGEGAFLAEILARKLETVKKNYKKSSYEYEQNSVLAITSIYGIDIMMDNVLACRERMFAIWNSEYTRNCGRDANDEAREAVKYILSKNIVLGNALSMMCVDGEGNDTDKPIIFPEWAFVTGPMLKRRDYRFDVLLKENSDGSMYDTQFSIFADDAMGQDNWMIDPITNELVPKPVEEFEPIHYRRVSENG
ncbi:MAG: restriction endonuclease subunit M [Clostridia bacterium]|nr:restriction endonuclease subunit M [Clostridia bacterium]